jgi:hypothetical protein
MMANTETHTRTRSLNSSIVAYAHSIIGTGPSTHFHSRRERVPLHSLRGMLHRLKCCFSLTFCACLWHAVASFVGELPQVEQGGLLDPILAGQKNLDETLNGFMEFSKVTFCLCVVCPHECTFAFASLICLLGHWHHASSSFRVFLVSSEASL